MFRHIARSRWACCGSATDATWCSESRGTSACGSGASTRWATPRTPSLIRSGTPRTSSFDTQMRNGRIRSWSGLVGSLRMCGCPWTAGCPRFGNIGWIVPRLSSSSMKYEGIGYLVELAIDIEEIREGELRTTAFAYGLWQELGNLLGTCLNIQFRLSILITFHMERQTRLINPNINHPPPTHEPTPITKKHT